MGFDHTTQGSYAAAAGVAKALRLDAIKTANAIAMSGTANNALRITRTGKLSNWKGLAYPNTAFSAVHVSFLAMRGITGPLGVFEGNKGFKENHIRSVSINWENKTFESIKKSIVKKYNAEIHSQSSIEGILELRERYGFNGQDVQSIEVEIFQVAYDIIGGGEEGPKNQVRTEETQSDRLPYMIAVALLDGELYPDQYLSERIVAADVQKLLASVRITPNSSLSARFPREMPTRVVVNLRDGRRYEIEKLDYEGFHTRPMTWDGAVKKFQRLSEKFADGEVLRKIEYLVDQLEGIHIRDLTKVLSAFQNDETQGRKTMINPDSERAFSFIPINERGEKPRMKGVTEIRGPYYSVMGKRYLSDILETMGKYVDGLKFAGGSFALMPRERVKELIDLAHQYDVYVSTGGWIERVLCHGTDVVIRYMEEVKNLGFDVIELSTGYLLAL